MLAGVARVLFTPNCTCFSYFDMRICSLPKFMSCQKCQSPCRSLYTYWSFRDVLLHLVILSSDHLLLHPASGILDRSRCSSYWWEQKYSVRKHKVYKALEKELHHLGTLAATRWSTADQTDCKPKKKKLGFYTFWTTIKTGTMFADDKDLNPLTLPLA